MAKRKRHSEAEITAKLAEADALAADGRKQDEIARTLGVSVMTFHRWRKAQPYISRSQVAIAPTEAASPTPPAPRPEPERMSRIAELQLENTRLRKLVTDLLLEKMRLEDESEGFIGRAVARK
jgi:putative transposase